MQRVAGKRGQHVAQPIDIARCHHPIHNVAVGARTPVGRLAATRAVRLSEAEAELQRHDRQTNKCGTISYLQLPPVITSIEMNPSRAFQQFDVVFQSNYNVRRINDLSCASMRQKDPKTIHAYVLFSPHFQTILLIRQSCIQEQHRDKFAHCLSCACRGKTSPLLSWGKKVRLTSMNSRRPRFHPIWHQG